MIYVTLISWAKMYIFVCSALNNSNANRIQRIWKLLFGFTIFREQELICNFFFLIYFFWLLKLCVIWYISVWHCWHKVFKLFKVKCISLKAERVRQWIFSTFSKQFTLIAVRNLSLALTRHLHFVSLLNFDLVSNKL